MTDKGIIVVKLGGSVLESKDTALADAVTLQKRGYRLVLVHGGAAAVTAWVTKLGLPTRMIDGERVTDAATLEIVTAVLSGLVNKQIVAAVIAAGGQACASAASTAASSRPKPAARPAASWATSSGSTRGLSRHFLPPA